MKKELNKTSKVTFYITRHGQTLLNALNRVQGWCDSPLTKEGIEIAEHLGKGMDEIHFDAAYCSDLRRTRQTAEIILSTKKQPNMQITELDGLRECCFGSYESDFNYRMWTDIAIYHHYITNEALHDAFVKREITYREILHAVNQLDKMGTAESYEQVKNRAYNALLKIVEKESGKNESNVLVVSHGMTILVLMWALDGGELIADHLKNASVSKVVYECGKFKVESVGDMSYVNQGKNRT
ncbi:MAG: histidine phosphatase family protein [Dysgonomonas sp.]